MSSPIKKCFGDFFSNNTILVCLFCGQFEVCKKISVGLLPVTETGTKWGTTTIESMTKRVVASLRNKP